MLHIGSDEARYCLFSAAFSDICSHSCTAPAHLTREAIYFFSREPRRNSVNLQRQEKNFLPNLKSSKIFHQAPRLRS